MRSTAFPPRNATRDNTLTASGGELLIIHNFITINFCHFQTSVRGLAEWTTMGRCIGVHRWYAVVRNSTCLPYLEDHC